MKRPLVSLSRLDRGSDAEYLIGDWCLKPSELYEHNPNVEVLTKIILDKSFYITSKKVTSSAYDEILPAICLLLNEKVNKSFTIEFWELMLGPWLRQFLDVLYHRYTHLASVDISNFNVLLIRPEDTITPKTSDEFATLIFSDQLNHQILGQIIDYCNLTERRSYMKANDTMRVNKTIGRPKRNSVLVGLASAISMAMSRRSKVLIINGYIDYKLLIKGFFKNKWTPIPYAPKYKVTYEKPNLLERDTLFKKHDGKFTTKFTRLSYELIKKNMPIIFFEEIKNLIKFAEATYPKRAKKIITANHNSLGELAAAWIAWSKSQNAARYIILQHGSNYGQSLINTDEEIEMQLGDIFLTSGWSQRNQSNHHNCEIQPHPSACRMSGVRKFTSIKPTKFNGNYSLLILASFPRYYYTGWTAPQGHHFKEYITEIVDLYKNLNPKLQEKIICREYHYDYGWNDKAFLAKNGLKFFNSGRRQSLSKLMKKSSYNIFSYNSTAFNESLIRNHITLAYWSPERWAWRDSAKPVIDELKKANIYHASGDSLAYFLNKFNDLEDIYSWWNSSKVQKARELFCLNFANNLESETKKWNDILRSN